MSSFGILQLAGNGEEQGIVAIAAGFITITRQAYFGHCAPHKFQARQLL